MNAEFLTEKLSRAGIAVSKDKVAELCRYAELIVTENEKYNLTAITDDEGVAVKHFADSLLGEPLLPLGATVVDLGSGAGLPAIPLALLRPDLAITAVESTGKKANFLTLASTQLGLGNLNVQNARIEDVARSALRESFDVVTARAVAPLNTLLEYAFPLLKTGGVLIAYKGQSFATELEDAAEALKKFHGEVEKVSHLVLENCEKRVIMEIRKTADTPTEYPRPQNKPRLKPIGGKRNG